MSELEFDTLKINIESDASQASNSLKDLANNIRNLGKSLKTDNLKSFSDNLKNVGNSVNGLTGATNKINEVSNAINNMVNSLNKAPSEGGFGIKKKDIDVVKKKLTELYDVQKKVIEEGAKSKSLVDKDGFMLIDNKFKGEDWEDTLFNGLGQASTNAADRLSEVKAELKDLIEGFAKYKNTVDSTTQSIYEWVKSYGSINIKGLSKEIDNFGELRSKLGTNFNYKKWGTPWDVWLGEMDEALGTHFNDMGVPDAFEKLASVLSEARLKTLSFDEAVKLSQQDARDSAGQVNEFAEKIRILAENIVNAENRIRQTAEAIRSLMTAGNGQFLLTDKLGQFQQQAQNGFIFDIRPNLNLDTVMGEVKQLPAVIYDSTAPVFARIEAQAAETAQKFQDYVKRAFTADIKPNFHFEDNVKQLPAVIANVYKQVPPLVLDVDYSEVTKAETPLDRVKQIIDEILAKLKGVGESAKAAFSNFRNKITPKKAEKTPLVSGGSDKEVTESDPLKKLAGLMAVEHELEKLSGIFNKLGNSFTWLSKKMLLPIQGVVNEYKEKLERVAKFFENFRKKAQASLAKLSAFWKRTMKTFTFMLVRKAITAIIGNINEATQSLAEFSKEVGTAFNDNISNAIADVKWIAKAIIGAFEPIINYVVPVLNVLSAALVRVITLLGHFFAAMTGQSYYMVAKKKVEDYTGSLKKAQKATQLSIRGFDELNNLTSSKNSDNDDTNNPADNWEMKPVSDKMKKFADMIKDLAKKLWEPIKKAWDRTKDYVISGFKYMVGELAKLGKDIGRDFLKVWRQEATVKIFENLFLIVGDIERVIGNLAKRFREAWNEGSKGLHIFENIRDIIGILVQHVRNVTRYMVDWSDSINFNPLLKSVERLTGALKLLADFIGSVFEDVMKNVVLKYVKWLTEEGTPHLLNTISELIKKVDWERVRRGLFIVEQAFEKLLENVHTGVTNAIGLVGGAIADWLNSDDFIKFMQAIANLMNQITAERVEKVLGGIGLAIVNIAKALADFVSSDKFQGFVEGIGKWIDEHDANDIASIAEKIFGLAAAFKVLASLTSKLAGLFSILYKISTLKMGLSLIKGLNGINGAAAGASSSVGILTKLGDALAKISQVKAGGLSGILSGIGGKATAGLAGLKTFFTADIGTTFAAGGATAGATFIAALTGGIVAAIGGYSFGKWFGDKFIDKGETGVYKDFKIFDFKNLFSGDVKADVSASLNALVDMFTDFENNPVIATLTNVLSGPFASASMQIADFIRDGGFKTIGDNAKTAGESVSESFSNMGSKIDEKITPIKENATQLWSDVSGAASLAWQDITQGVADVDTKIKGYFEPLVEFFHGFGERVKAIFEGTWIIIKATWISVSGWFNSKVIQPTVAFFKQLWADIKAIWNSVSTWFNTNVVQPIVGFFRQLWTDVSGFFKQLWADIQAVWTSVTTWFNTTIIQPLVGFFRQAWVDIKGFFTQLWVDIKAVWGAVAGWFNATIIQPVKNAFNVAVSFIKSIFTTLWNSIKSGAKACFNGIIGVFEKLVNGVVDGINTFIKGFNFVAKAATKVTGDSYGGVELVPKVKLPRFETGGFPEDGWFRAEHGEIMGQFDNGQSVIANNTQIIEGIEGGVQRAMMSVLPTIVSAIENNSTSVVVEGDTDKIFKAFVKKNSNMNKRTFGSSPLYT